MKILIQDYCPDCEHPADQHKLTIIDESHYSLECETCKEGCLKVYETFR